MSKKTHRTAKKKPGPTKPNQHKANQKSSAHITKISATNHRATATVDTPEPTRVQKVSLKSKSAQKADQKAARLVKKARAKADKKGLAVDEKPLKSYFILARPFVATGRYIRDSWRELRQVRWPSRKATWKLTGAVLVYCAILMGFILVLDLLFTFLFNLIIK